MTNNTNIERARGRLSKEYPGDQYGTWEITGEDPNCDLGGPHHNPQLGYLKGRYDEVLEKALTLGGFFQWGSGGYIKPVEVEDINGVVEELSEIEELEKKYVLTAISGRDGRVFYALDTQSGGYPYWTEYVQRAEQWDELNKATAAYEQSTTKYLKSDGITQIKIGVITTTIDLKDIDDPLAIAQRKKAILSKLSEEERKILGV